MNLLAQKMLMNCIGTYIYIYVEMCAHIYIDMRVYMHIYTLIKESVMGILIYQKFLTTLM